MNRFTGKTAFVTGAGSGIGRATALALAAEGASVACADLDAGSAAETRDAIRTRGAEAEAFALDVVEETSIAAAVTATMDTFGGLDLAFNGAGITGPTFVPVAQMDTADHDRVIAVNLRGTFLCLKHQTRLMLSLPPGPRAIVNASSVAGLVGTKMSAAYAASKHGVIGLTKSVAQEVSAKGIRVNAVCPGWIETPMTDPLTGSDPVLRDKMIKRHPIGRLGTAQDIAATVLWLLSEDAGFVTGAAIAADGGFTAH